MMRYLTLAALSLLVCFSVAACGDKKQALDVVDWPHLEKSETLKINGTEMRGFVLKTEMQRRRGRNGLAIKAGEALAYLYPKLEEAPQLKFNNVPLASKLVFISDSGKVLKVESLKPFSEAKFPQTWRVEGTRVVLQVTVEDFDKLKLGDGQSLASEPDLVKSSADAEGEFATLFFLTENKSDEKPKDAPFVRLKVLDEAEDVAQGLKNRPELKDGEGVLIPTGSGAAEFWLKEVDGPCCACWLERAQRGLVVSGLYENIKSEGSRDLDRPIFYSATKPMFLALFKGADYFTKNKVEDRARISIGGIDLGEEDKIDYESIDIKFGDKPLNTRLVRGSTQIREALLDASTLAAGKGLVFDFDDAAFVELECAGLNADVEALFISADASGKYVVAERKILNGQSAAIKAGDIKHGRFVIVAAKGFDTKAELKFPYSLRDLKPSLPAVTFYAEKSEVVTDRWPTKALGRANVELAISDAEQRKGLMYRTGLKQDHGMIFIYKADQEEMSYWMKNCKMDLAIAYVDRKGVIVKIHNRMKAPAPNTPDQDLPTYDSGSPARYAIEMEADWYEKHGIKAGDRVFIPPKLLEGGE